MAANSTSENMVKLERGLQQRRQGSCSLMRVAGGLAPKSHKNGTQNHLISLLACAVLRLGWQVVN